MPKLKEIFIKDLKASHAEELIKRLKSEKHNERGVNLIFGVLESIMNNAIERELIDKNPFVRVKTLKEKPKHETYWTKLEIGQFLRANLNSPNYPSYVLALNSGMRRGELAGLCWDRIDFERNQIEVSRTRDRYGLRETTKTGIKRYVPMNLETRRVLEGLRRKQLDLRYIFCEAPNEPFSECDKYRFILRRNRL